MPELPGETRPPDQAEATNGLFCSCDVRVCYCRPISGAGPRCVGRAGNWLSQAGMLSASFVQPPASINRAEVERARKLIAETCTGCVITDIDTVEDKIVYDGADHLEFVS